MVAGNLNWLLQKDIIPTCRELGIGIVAYSPLGRGFLTGTVTDFSQFAEGDFRLTLPRFQKETLEKVCGIEVPLMHFEWDDWLMPDQGG